MKKMLFVMLFCLCGITASADTIDIMPAAQNSGIIGFFEQYESEGNVFSDLNTKQIVSKILGGENIFNIKGIFGKIVDSFTSEIQDSLALCITMFILIIIYSVFNASNISESDEAKRSVYFVFFMVLSGIFIKYFYIYSSNTKETVESINLYMKGLIPVVIGAVAAGGNVATAGGFNATLFIGVEIISEVVVGIIYPLIYISFILSIVGNFSEKYEFGSFIKFFKKTVVWLMTGITVLFSGLLTVQSFVTISMDNMSGKATKFAAGTFIPVIGTSVSEALETISGSLLVIKNIASGFGIIVLLGFILTPILKILAGILLIKLTSAIAQPVSDGRFTRLTDDVCESMFLFIAVIALISVMFIISLAIIAMLKPAI